MAQLKNTECPSCGAPIEVQAGVKALTCEFCGSVLMNEQPKRATTPPVMKATEIKVKKEDRGPLVIGSTGFYKNAPFKIVGVLEYEDDEGWRWVEYFIRFDDGRSAWLEYDDGKYKLLFDLEFDDEIWKPRIGFGKKLKLPNGQKFKVTEKSGSKIIYMWGQIPFSAAPNVKINFIDGKDPKNKRMKYSVEYTKKETEAFAGPAVNVRKVNNEIHIEDK